MGTLRFTRGFPPPTMAAVSGRRHQPTPSVQISAVGPRVEPVDVASTGGTRKGSWVLKILRVNSLWAKERESEKEVGRAEEEGEADTCPGCLDGCPVVDGEGEEEEKVEVFDRSRFFELLRRVSMVELEVYAKMSYLGILAYNIPNIKPVSLLKHYGLRFVTSSLEKKAPSLDPEKEQLTEKNTKRDEQSRKGEEGRKKGENGYRLSPAAAYDTVASAASFLQSQTRSILPLSVPSGDKYQSELCNVDDIQGGISSSDMASFVATTNSVTAVVAGKEEMKEAVAKDLNSASSCPCEWFICDDDESSTRYFVVQGSESMASWQANLLFEPIQFEGMDVLVHRGIYEAAKGIYQQMRPEVRAHLDSKGNSATLRFTGHSLGGSLCLLVNLMLLIRGEVPTSALLPVITFGSPTIMCGGDYLLRKLGLPESHVQAITMHRDIVPRAFSCNYPDHVAKILKAVNGNFRKHPCLNNQKLLYAPMGKLLILQPDEKFSPHHDFLPPGSGLYLLVHSSRDPDNSTRILQAARTAFLNTPHPLEILSDRSAYGLNGTVHRDHDMQAYMRSVFGVFRQELKLIRKAKREHRRRLWWPLVAVEGRHTSTVLPQGVTLTSSSQHHFSFVGVLNGGKETLKRFGKILAFRNVNMFIVLLFPARILLMGTLSLMRFG